MGNLLDDFKNSIFSSEATSLAKDYTEVALDSILDDGVLKDIPVIGSIVGLFKIGSSIKERHTIRKIAEFLNRLEDVTEEEKTAFLQRLDQEKEGQDLFEKLLLLLERLDETLKARIVGNLFRMYIMDVFDRNLFLRCCMIVEKAFLADLISHYKQFSYRVGRGAIQEDVVQAYDDRMNSKLTKQNLVNLGVLDLIPTLKRKQGSRSDSPEFEIQTKTEINKAGEVLAGYMFYDFKDPEFQKLMVREKEYFQGLREVYSKVR